MCGISGIYNFHEQSIVNLKDKLKYLSNHLSHRGPDYSGIWCDEKKTIGLVHNRLSIIDLSNEANQPMSSNNGNVITFNGEIYNFKELKKKLNYDFKTSSDTEVILAMYEKFGLESFKLLEGMFSFVIWDINKKELICCRDRFGIKPFYYFVENDNFYFASEVKVLLEFKKKLEINTSKLSEYLIYQFNIGEDILFKNIKQLCPGNYLRIKNKIKKKEFWKFSINKSLVSFNDNYKKKINQKFVKSIEKHLISDTKVTTYLSGGIDSSLVTFFSKNKSNSFYETYHGFFDNFLEINETYYAEILSNKLDIKLNKVKITSQDVEKNLKKIIYSLDFPVGGPGSIPQYLLCKKISEKYKVVLGGQGSDELFGGYARHLIMNFENAIVNQIDDKKLENDPSLEALIPLLKILKGYQFLIKRQFSDGLFENIESRYFSLLDRSKKIRKLFEFEEKEYEDHKVNFLDLFNEKNNLKNLSLSQKMCNFDLKYFLPSLLHVEDRMSMSFGLESRVPFLDNELVDLSMSIPSKEKFDGNNLKGILIETFKNTLPKEIINRKDKMGFPVPLKDLNFFSKLVNNIKDSLLSRNLSFINKKNLKNTNLMHLPEREIWALVSLEMWFQNFLDNNKKIMYN